MSDKQEYFAVSLSQSVLLRKEALPMLHELLRGAIELKYHYADGKSCLYIAPGKDHRASVNVTFYSVEDLAAMKLVGAELAAKEGK